MTQSICILTMPRSGSEVLMHYLSDGYGYEYAGEFLSQPLSFHQRVIPGEKDNLFCNSYQSVAFDHRELIHKDYNRFIVDDFHLRLQLIEEHHTPLIVKSFVSNPYYRIRPDGLDKMDSQFRLVILARKDPFKAILSSFICNQLKTWHVTTDEAYGLAREKLSNLKFEIPEDEFLRSVNHWNFLKHLQQCSFSNATVLDYEDYASSPVESLNSKFGLGVEKIPVNIRGFIDDHTSHILNFSRIESLYRKFITKVC